MGKCTKLSVDLSGTSVSSFSGELFEIEQEFELLLKVLSFRSSLSSELGFIVIVGVGLALCIAVALADTYGDALTDALAEFR